MGNYVVGLLLIIFVVLPVLGERIGRATNELVGNFYQGRSEALRQFLFFILLGFFLTLFLVIGVFLVSLTIQSLSSGLWAALENQASKFLESFFQKEFYVFSLLSSVSAYILAQIGRFTVPSNEEFRRGRELNNYRDAFKVAKRLANDSPDEIYWGGCPVAFENTSKHFCVVGATGSGKTLTLRFLMQGAFQAIGRGRDTRAIVYDAKMDMLPCLFGMGFKEERVITLNPFDKRCAAWDMAADITSPASAQQLATILIPEQKHASQPFFADAARHILRGVIISFIKTAPGAWDFRDVVLALKSKSKIKQVLSRIPETKDALEYFDNEQTGNNIMATISTKMQRYEFIAAAWSRAEKTISLREWIESESVLVLGNDEATRSALDAINRVIFQRLTELILAQSESKQRRTWIFLDEVREAGYLDGLSRLLTKGRSKGACVVLGFQDIEGLREVYGKQVANELVGQCAHKAILRLESPETAEWASSLFGTKEVLERTSSKGESSSMGKVSKSKSTNEQISTRTVVLPSELMSLPATNPQNGLTGYYLTPELGAYTINYSGKVLSESLLPIAEDVLGVDPRDEDDQYLAAWSEEELEHSGLSGKENKDSKETKSAVSVDAEGGEKKKGIMKDIGQ